MKNKVYLIPKLQKPVFSHGNANKGLLIILREEDRRTNDTTLQSLIKAIKLDPLEDVLILGIGKNPIDINSIIKEKEINTIILLGTSSKDIGHTMLMKPNFWYNMEFFSILSANSLQEMNSNVAFKKALWQNLQQKFL